MGLFGGNGVDKYFNTCHVCLYVTGTLMMKDIDQIEKYLRRCLHFQFAGTYGDLMNYCFVVSCLPKVTAILEWPSYAIKYDAKKQYSYLRTFSSIPIGVWFAVNYVINSDSNRKHGCRGLDPRWTWGFQSALSWVRRWRHRSLLLWRYCDVIDNDNVIVVISPDCFTAHGAPCGTTPPWAKLIREH